MTTRIGLLLGLALLLVPLGSDASGRFGGGYRGGYHGGGYGHGGYARGYSGAGYGRGSGYSTSRGTTGGLSTATYGYYGSPSWAPGQSVVSCFTPLPGQTTYTVRPESVPYIVPTLPGYPEGTVCLGN